MTVSENAGTSSQRSCGYTPQQVANYFLDRADEEHLPMTQLKLLKLVYIAYGWNLALTGRRLFDEKIEAWQHGPVVKSLYHEFKHFKSSPIIGRSEDVDLDSWDTVEPRIPDEDKETLLILQKVWVSYRRFKGWDLRNKTHEKGGPWSKVYQDGIKGIKLSDQDIATHYEQRIEKYLSAS
ncbi:MAG: type II toxin-antitoxin system antitoxin SocA domain-containing protein, partial [Pseudomonadota bacterium]